MNSRRKVNTGITKLQDENGEITENNQNKAEILNNYFHSVFVKEDKSSLPNLEDRSKGNSVSDIEN